MAGYTGFSVGVVNKSPVYIPIPQLVASSPRNMDPHGATWERILAMTGQPNTASSTQKQDNVVVQVDASAADTLTATLQAGAEDTLVIESGIPEPTAH